MAERKSNRLSENLTDPSVGPLVGPAVEELIRTTPKRPLLDIGKTASEPEAIAEIKPNNPEKNTIKIRGPVSQVLPSVIGDQPGSAPLAQVTPESRQQLDDVQRRQVVDELIDASIIV